MGNARAARRQASAACWRVRRETGRHDALRRARVPSRTAVARLAGVARDRRRRTGLSGVQGRGWNTDAGEGCPKNPDLFREVIARAEAFLASHPRTDFRKQVLYALAVANESWWSIAHAPAATNGSTRSLPAVRLNAQQASRARDEAIRDYREVASLFRQLPRPPAHFAACPVWN